MRLQLSGGSARAARAFTFHGLRFVACILALSHIDVSAAAWREAPGSLTEINRPAQRDSNRVIAIVGATLVDGRGGLPISNAAVLVRGERIAAVSRRDALQIPPDAEVFNAIGLTLVPGLMDAHFHIERDYELPRLFLSHGITSVRDPGQWLQIYKPIVDSELPQPRCFVAGPHLDVPPHAHPQDAFAVTNTAQVRVAVNRFVDEGRFTHQSLLPATS